MQLIQAGALLLGGIMESYLVRIYRRQENNPRLLIGVVEEPGVKEKRAFQNVYELWDILNSTRKTLGKSGGNGSKKQKRKNGSDQPVVLSSAV